MERRVTKIYIAVLVVGLLFGFMVEVSFSNRLQDSRTARSSVAVWEQEMTLTRDGGASVFGRILPMENLNKKVIIYNTAHMYLEVLIDGAKVYELRGKPGGLVKTTGYCWNVITLRAEDAGKEISFRVTPVYSGMEPQTVFYYGSYRKIVQKILTEQIFRLTLTINIALVGLAMLLYGIFVVRSGPESEAVLHFATFAVMLGIWATIETQIPDWLLPASLLVVFTSHLVLMTMPIPFLLFLRHMYHDEKNRLWSVCCYLDCAVVIVRLALQMTGLYDLRETLALTHLYLLFFVGVLVYMTVREVRENRWVGLVRVNSVCVSIVLASTLVEMALFRYGNKSTPLGSAGFMLYIIVMGIVNVRRSRALMEQAQEAALYRKLALTDELTGLANRTAFKEDLEKRMEPDKAAGTEKILPTVVYMFDLNDLKKCNDNYGHEYGDRYIKMAADVLTKVFDEEGRCYRIGGDEFCAWSPYRSQEEIDKKLLQIEQNVKRLNTLGFVVTVSIAVGYAVYQEGADGGGLYSTMKRADAMMYEKKQKYKAERGIVGR